MSSEKNNPNSMIQNQLLLLRAEKEKAISDIYSLEQEKKIINEILPKILYELTQLQENIIHNNREMQIYDYALDEIEKSYGEFLYSPEYFSQHP